MRLAMIWSMTMLRLRAAEAPFDDYRVAGSAARLTATVEALGLWEAKEPVERLDAQLFQEVLDALADAEVATFAPLEWRGYADKGADAFAEWIEHVRAELSASPVPEHALPVISELLGAEVLSGLLGVSPASVRRYASGVRDVPDDVAARAHVVALIVADLAGSYNERGIRRWFARPRTQLGGRAPTDVLTDEWDPDGEQARRVRELSAARIG